MAAFAIQHGATPLFTWQLDGGRFVAHPQAIELEGLPVLPEHARVGFVLDPADDGRDYRVRIGDVPLADIAPSPEAAAGMLLGGRRFWPDLAYFDSARGKTLLVLEAKSEVDQEVWTTLLSAHIYIQPSKLGDDRYQAMTADLERVSRSLLVDLYGKSRQSVDVRYAKAGQTHDSHEAELRAIEATLARIEVLLRSIAQRPASRITTTTRSQQYWGGQRLPPATVAEFAQRGIDPATAPRPVPIAKRVRVESFDIAEHRNVQAFLSVLLRRCRHCASASLGHVRAITSEKHLRNLRLGEGPTIYESVDLPRIARLRHALATAQRCETLALSMKRLPFLREAPPEFVPVRGGVFHRNEEYRALLLVIRRFLEHHAQWYEGEQASAVTKLTWRIFEQWTFLRIVDAFRNAGAELREWTDALRGNLRSRFIVDFDRGLMFEGTLGQNLRLRFRYEPWILGRSAAVQNQETLHRGRSGEVAWCPDIVVECLRCNGETWTAVYAIVLDCKYTAHVTNQHWSEITKYLEIRSTATGRQVVKQLWLVSPGETARVSSEDPSVEFTSLGPSCDADEAVRFQLRVTPDSTSAESDACIEDDAFRLFAEGTLAFLRRTFGPFSAAGH